MLWQVHKRVSKAERSFLTPGQPCLKTPRWSLLFPVGITNVTSVRGHSVPLSALLPHPTPHVEGVGLPTSLADRGLLPDWQTWFDHSMFSLTVIISEPLLQGVPLSPRNLQEGEEGFIFTALSLTLVSLLSFFVPMCLYPQQRRQRNTVSLSSVLLPPVSSSFHDWKQRIVRMLSTVPLYVTRDN